MIVAFSVFAYLYSFRCPFFKCKKKRKEWNTKTKNRVETTNHGRLKCLSLQWHCRCLLQIHMFRRFFPLSIQKHVNVLCHWIYGPWILRGMAIYVLKSALFIKYSRSFFSSRLFFGFYFWILLDSKTLQSCVWVIRLLWLLSNFFFFLFSVTSVQCWIRVEHVYQ